MQVVVLGQGERAQAHRDWYRRAGMDLVPAADPDAGPLPGADLYHLCAEGDEGLPALTAVWRGRRRAVLVSGCFPGTAAEALRQARRAARQRCAAAVAGGWRWVPAFARLRELTAGGTLGTVRHVEASVSAPRGANAAELVLAAMDLGLWLAEPGDPVPESSDAATVRFRAGEAAVTVRLAEVPDAGDPHWALALEADLGRAAASARFLPGYPGHGCREQSAAVLRQGRWRTLTVPDTDPAACELAVLLTRQRAGEPWLGLCTLERAAVLVRLRAGLAPRQDGPEHGVRNTARPLGSPDPEEFFVIVDEDDRAVGRASRRECHGNPALVHRTAHVVVRSSDGRILLQKRNRNKDIQPGKWDTAVGGHVHAGESYEEAARREMAEEIGLAGPLPLQHLFDTRIRNAVESENVRVFGLTHDGPFVPQAGEIEALRFWTAAEVDEALGTGCFTPNLEAEIAELRRRGLL